MLRKIFNSTKKSITGKPISSKENNPNLAEEKNEPSNKTIEQDLPPVIKMPEVQIIDKPENSTIIEEPVNETIQSNIHKIKNELKSLCHIVETHKKSTNWSCSYNAVMDAKTSWDEYDTEDINEELKSRFDDSYNHFLKRYGAHKIVKSSIAARENICDEIKKFIDFPDTAKVNDIEKIILSWNDLAEIPERYDEILTKKFQQLSKEFDNSKNELQNRANVKKQITPTLENICSNIEKLAETDADSNIIVNLKKLEAEWNSFSVDYNIEEYVQRFENSKNIIEQKCKEINEVNEKNSLEIKNLCNKIKEYSQIKHLKSVLSDVKELQKSWDSIKADKIKNHYSNEYKKYYRLYFSKLKYLQQKEDWARWENYTKKTLLCEQIEKLVDQPDLHKVSKEIKSIWTNWRKIGSVPKEKNELVWERFNSKRQILLAKCKNFYLKQDENRQVNYDLKFKLCEQAEELKDSTDWEPTAGQLKSIQEEWKKIGRAPQPHNDELFTRLRKACNHFFENRIKFYDNLHSIQLNNKEIKKNICEEAKNLSSLPREKALKKIKEMHSLWKKTGSASRKDEQKLWQYFNSELDDFFNKLENEKPLNLKKKNDLCIELEELLNKNYSNSRDELDDLKSKINNIKFQWENIGFVPKKDENLLTEKYNKKLNELLEKYHNLQTVIKNLAIDELYSKESLFNEIESLANNTSEANIEEQLVVIKEKWNNSSYNTVCASDLKCLEDKFEKECNELNNNNIEYFNNLHSLKNDNLESKKRILVQLEKLANINITNDINNSLAEELKLAIESNFASKEKVSTKDCIEKYNSLLEQWSIKDSIPLSEYKTIYDRFNNACAKLNLTLQKDI
ncbi:MAG TPA: DUF349 domain-containing protein [Victivallales bacterium]|nr:DUF349 domain-containing protein [Victivallales bacterium]